MSLDTFRKLYTLLGEAIDVLRVFPRLFLVGYAWLLYRVVEWYMNLEPYFPNEIKPFLKDAAEGGIGLSEMKEWMVQAPTTQHAVLITAVVGIAAAVFGFYTNTGQKWNDYTFRQWKGNKSSTDQRDTDKEDSKDDRPPRKKPPPNGGDRPRSG